MDYRLTDTDRRTFQQLLDQLSEAGRSIGDAATALDAVARGHDGYALSTVAHVWNRLLVVQGRIETARDRLASLLDHVNAALTAPVADDAR